MKRKRVCIVATVPFALMMFMKPHIFMLSEKYDLTLIAKGKSSELELLLRNGVKFIPIDIERKISIWNDFYVLIQLFLIFRKNQFDAVHSIMPKAGLLAMLAAYFSRVPTRIHTFTGQVWANKTGLVRLILKLFDKIIALFSTNLLTDSFSQRDFLINQNISDNKKIRVLGYGSVCGVDTGRFKQNLIVRNKIRASLGIPIDAMVFLYLGRLNRDKGVLDLAASFNRLIDELPNAHLMMVGPDEEGIAENLYEILKNCRQKFHLVGFSAKPEDYMASADIFCLQSYREGFGSVVVEAAAVGLPAIASNIYGLVDAVVNGETGILHEVGNIEEITQAMLLLSCDDNLRARMGSNAEYRVKKNFTTDVIRQEMRIFYEKLLD
ncbi:glycosyltransferase family 4 protein [Collimonas sp.]|jgi:glycosyltransferase involved in cell wall biosynthesis|uniref:glycosyltransferase family 4 protein n=1 Tax=Collimonas sp. TaxID=1963772 RepID=UPI002BF94783|nr:glycosyltransferase family 4 protein [Collimonas sp.]HWX00134.1 glycosyltransferase family 4 protein [Collimonas sp.]